MEIGVLLFEDADGRVQRRFILKVGGNSLGRDASNDIVLDAPDVRRFQARIIYTDDECTIVNLSESGDTQVNGEALRPGVERVLRNGDRIRINAFVIRFVRAQSNPRPRTVPPDVASRVPGPRLQSTLRPRLRPRAPVYGQRSRYLDLLPPIYELRDEESVLNSLLLICEAMLSPLDSMIAQLHYYLDPATAPEALLPWLATWVDLALNENWPLEQRRQLVRQATELYRWRGTRRGLRDYIRIYAGAEPVIIEQGQEQLMAFPADTQRVQVSDDNQALRTVSLGPADQQLLQPYHFRVFVDISQAGHVSLELLQTIIEAEKPAHASYTLYVRRSQNS